MLAKRHNLIWILMLWLVNVSCSAIIYNITLADEKLVNNRSESNSSLKSLNLVIQEDISKIFLEDNNPGSSGCYISNPIQIGLNYKKAMMPLRSIDYNIDIVNSLAHITLQQQYENPSNRFLSVYYSFPIRPQSSLYKFIAKFGNVVVEGVVKEKSLAQAEFEKAKSQGRQAALGSINTDSKDIINLQIGNIPPKSRVKISISFIQELSLSLNTFYNLQVPSTISPRFMNSIPVQNIDGTINRVVKPLQSASISPLQLAGTPGYTWQFTINIQSTRKINFYNSTSHKLQKLSESDDGRNIILSFEDGQIPNEDFIFLYTTENFQLPSYVVGRNQDTTTIQISFIPRFSKLEVKDVYNMFAENNSVPEFDIQNVKGEYIFIIDRSGSMQGIRIQRARQALSIFLKSLPADSYFNIISFGTLYQKSYPQSQRNENKKIKQAISSVLKMQADLGGTQIYYPLKLAITEPGIYGYPRFIFLLTDGTVSNTEDVISMVRMKAYNVRISTIGIGNGASSQLIQGCAKAGRGKFIMISDDQQPSQKIISVLEASLTPLITSIDFKYDQNNLLSAIPNPKTIPYILKDSIVNIYFTYKNQPKQKQKFSLTYQDSVSNQSYSSSIQIDQNSKSYPFIDKIAHFKVLRALENLSKDTEINPIDLLNYKIQNKQLKEQAQDYSIKYQILSEYTSFIAVGRQLIDSEKQIFKGLGYQVVEVQQTKPIQYVNEIVVPFLSAMPLVGALPSPPSMITAQPLIIQSTIEQVMTQQPKIIYEQAIAFAPEMPQPSIQLQPSSLPLLQVVSQPVVDNTIVSNKDQVVSKLISQKKIQNPQLKVEQVINNQNANGSWSDETLIQKLAKDQKLVKNLILQIQKDVVITRLVFLWLQKQQVGKQYNLIIKKAQGWLTKTINENKIDENKLKTLQIK